MTSIGRYCRIRGNHKEDIPMVFQQGFATWVGKKNGIGEGHLYILKEAIEDFNKSTAGFTPAQQKAIAKKEDELKSLKSDLGAVKVESIRKQIQKKITACETKIQTLKNPVGKIDSRKKDWLTKAGAKLSELINIFEEAGKVDPSWVNNGLRAAKQSKGKGKK